MRVSTDLSLSSLFWANAGAASAVVAALAAPAFAQNKELSDKSVLTLMRYAWGMVQEKFTTPLGKTIIVDKTHASESIVPLDVAREVIRVARLSAYAQLCELPEEQRANYQTLMRREESMKLTGKVQLVEKDGDKQVVVQEGKPLKTESCTDTERKKIQDQIMTYVNSVPATPAAMPPPDKRAEPTPTSQKK